MLLDEISIVVVNFPVSCKVLYLEARKEVRTCYRRYLISKKLSFCLSLASLVHYGAYLIH